MPKQVDRRRFLVGLGATTSLALAGCAGDDPEEDPVETDDDDTTDPGDDDPADDDPGDDDDPPEEDEQQLELLQIPREVLDPIGISGPINAWTNWQVHEQLFTFEDGTPPVTTMLAEDYTLDDDEYLTYTFELREGITMHNGEEMTADDVIYSWRRLAESENNRGHGDRIVDGPMSVAHEKDDDDNIVPDSLELEALDDYTVEMTLESPFHGALGNLSDPRLSVIPEGIVGDIDGYDGEYDYSEWETEHLHGSGPFRLTNWDRGNEIILERYDDYHGDVANIDRVRFQILEDPSAVYTRAVHEQGADIFDIPRSQFDPGLLSVDTELEGDRREGTYGPLAGDTTLNYGETSLPRTQYLTMNHLRIDKPARQAISYLIDQSQIAEVAVRGQGTPAYFLTPPAAFPGGVDAYQEMAEEEYPYGYNETNIEAAQQVMEEAGYDEDNRYETTFQHPSDLQASEWREIASLLQGLAESAHIDLSIEEAPSSTLTNRALEGDITIYGVWNALEWLEADAMLRFAYPNPFAWSRWAADVDFEYDEMSDAAQQATDAWAQVEEHALPGEDNLAMREEAYLEMERANWEDVAMLPLWHPIEELYWYDWVENFEMHGSQRRPQLNHVEIGDRA